MSKWVIKLVWYFSSETRVGPPTISCLIKHSPLSLSLSLSLVGPFVVNSKSKARADQKQKTTKLRISWKWQKLFLFQFFFSLFLSLQGHQWTMINHNFTRSTQKFFLHTSFCHHINNTGFSFPFLFYQNNNGFFSSSNCCLCIFKIIT